MLIPKTLLNLGLDIFLGVFLKFENEKSWFYVNISTNNGTIRNVNLSIFNSYYVSLILCITKLQCYSSPKNFDCGYLYVKS